MKKLLSLTLLACSAVAAPSISARNTVDILGIPYTVDTLAYEKVGPGTTHTHLKMQSTASESQKLQVHYLTIDKSTPGVKLRAVCAKDKVAGTETTSAMAKRKSKGNTLYFAGCNGDFYTTSGNATNGTSKIGSPTTSCTADGIVYKTSNSNYQFAVDAEGVARIGRINYYTSTATIGDKVTLFKGINVASPNNGITIYTPKYWGSSNQVDYVDNAWEVSAKLVEGDEFVCGGKFRLEVTSEPSSAGDMAIPSDGFVIFGRGTSKTGCNTGAKDFVGALKVGDIVEFDHIVLMNDERIYPTQIVSGNPRTVGDGERLDSEGERTDASAQHPRTGIGYSQSGDSIIMMVVEGRMGGSVGVRTSQLADIMRYAGAWEALNLDGGGSSTLYTSAKGVVNRCSDGNERAVGNAIFATIDTDLEDKEITEIRFADWSLRMPQYGLYTPQIMGYNAAGLLVSESIEDYELSCPAELGEIVDGHTLYTTGSGCHALKVKVGDAEAVLAVTIDSECTFSAAKKEALVDSYRPYQIRLLANNGLKDIEVEARVLNWNSADVAIATVDGNGVVKGVSNGTTTVTGTVGDNVVEVKVTVEIPESERENIVADFKPEAWKLTKSGVAEVSPLAATETGFEYGYSISSTRLMNITLTPVEDMYFWSLPIAMDYDLTAQGIALKNINVKLVDALDNRISLTSEECAADTESTGRIKFEPDVDIANIAVYPLKLTSVVFNPTGSSGDKGSIDVRGLYAVYDPNAVSGVEECVINADADGADGSDVEYYNLQGMRINRPGNGQLVIRRQGAKASTVLVK